MAASTSGRWLAATGSSMLPSARAIAIAASTPPAAAAVSRRSARGVEREGHGQSSAAICVIAPAGGIDAADRDTVG